MPQEPNTDARSVNDHGLAIFGTKPLKPAALFDRTTLSTERLLTVALASLDSSYPLRSISPLRYR